MGSNQIDELLKRYWDCETSLEEEQELRELFRKHPISEQHKDAAALFQYFDQQKNRSLNDVNFDQSIAKKTMAPANGKFVKLFYNSMRIAAGVAVLMVATWIVRNEVRSGSPVPAEDTYDDPKLAFEETKKALMMTSKSFGTAEEKARNINLLNEAKEQVQKEKTPSQL